MGFLGVHTAIYDYEPRAEGELAIKEGDLLFVLEKGDDDGWWKAKKKAGADEEEEPVGLVPQNYVEEAQVAARARAIYEYTRQTDEELSFPEEAVLQVFDSSDPDWILVGFEGEYGFVPSNYIDMLEGTLTEDESTAIAPPTLPIRPQSIVVPKPSLSNTSSPPTSPATALAGVIQGRTRTSAEPLSPTLSTHNTRIRTQQTAPRISEEAESGSEAQSPALPSRSRSINLADKVVESPGARDEPESHDVHRTPGGFHLYNINEMVSIMGKRKKIPTTLGINLGTGKILIAPARSDDDPPQEWTADKMTHYSREGKHVFMELVRPSKSIDFHAGAKDTAEEIIAALGELAGAARAEGLREVILAGSHRGQRKGHILYDFVAQGEDEVTVAVDDDVVIIDDSRSDEWWQVRRLKTGKEGVVPSSYIEITGTVTPPQSSHSGIDRTRATVEQNRLEEIRLTKEAIKMSKEPQQVGHGMPLPERGSSLTAGEHGNNSRQQRGRRENGRGDTATYSKSKSKPNTSKVRTWTDRTKSFKVEAQFLGLKDGKIHLHKMNGVKIAVPVEKMSREDLEYVENISGISLDDDKPLADVKKVKATDRERSVRAGASVGKSAKPEYDWFQFFLSCDVPVGLCERYAQAFTKDSMDESVLPDVNATILRTLGLREGDIIKVMRALDAKFHRERNVQDNDAQSGGLFSGPGGALRNNTRKGRPAPAVQTSDIVDAAAFSKNENGVSGNNMEKAASRPKESSSTGTQRGGGFDDDAWDVKPHSTTVASTQRDSPKRAAMPSATEITSGAHPKMTPSLTGSMKDLSLLTQPPLSSQGGTTTIPALNSQEEPALEAQPRQPQGATPSFFSTMPSSIQPTPTLSTQAGSAASPSLLSRQRPTPPTVPSAQNSIVPPPPPQRPLSAPQSAQPSIFAPPYLTAQMTGSVQGQVAPAGQSLNDIAQARLQQQYIAQPQPLQPTMTGYIGFQSQNVAPFPTREPSQQQHVHPTMIGIQGASPFADANMANRFSTIQPQQTAYQATYPSNVSAFPHGVNSGVGLNNFLPPALEPQQTGVLGFQSQQTGLNGTSTQPLQPQKTGPPPPVRFGISPNLNRLAPQQTGRRANLSQATPDNPFGF